MADPTPNRFARGVKPMGMEGSRRVSGNMSKIGCPRFAAALRNVLKDWRFLLHSGRGLPSAEIAGIS